jgi:hypothetical protein
VSDLPVTGRELAAAGVLAAAFIPQRFFRHTPTVCTFRLVTGRPCPTCGMTRSWSAAAHLDIGEAFREHPFGPPSLVAAALIAFAPPGVFDRPVFRSPLVIVPLGALWIGVWLARLMRAGKS